MIQPVPRPRIVFRSLREICMEPLRGDRATRGYSKMPTREGIQRDRRFILAMYVVWFVAFFIAGCGSEDHSSSASSPEAKWTVMLYMAADSDIAASAFRDINELEDVGSSTDVNIVAQVEFSSEYTPWLPSGTLRGRIVEDHDSNEIRSDLDDMGDLDMTDPDILTSFIRWASVKYPARNYAIVLWSHGTGWKGSTKGIFRDETSSGEYVMSVEELSGALERSGVDMGLIDFDACLMGMYEVAYELRGLARYITFSEALFPVYGNPYFTILESLTTDPDMDAAELAHLIPVACEQSFASSDTRFTKSAVDMDGIALVHAGIQDLADALIRAMDSDGDQIRTAAENTVDYYPFPYRDLGDFLDQLKETTTDPEVLNAVTSLETALAGLVVENRVNASGAGDPYGHSQGLSIFLPAPGLNVSEDLDRYRLLACNQDGSVPWADFVTLLTED